MGTASKAALLTLVLATGALAGCAQLRGGTDVILQVGSSTVYPVAEAWAADLAARDVQVAVAGGGSGRGASAICAKEADIGDMSREIKQSEIDRCRANGVEPVVWEVAFDGLTVVTAKENEFIDHLTVDELEHIWRAQDAAQTWADVREGWPAEPIKLFGPDSDSGTFEYFNEEILGTDCGPEAKSQCPIRTDYTQSADDNVLVEGVSSSPYAIGHFGFSYFLENQVRVRAIPITPEGGEEAVEPTFETIASGDYKPLSRPLYMVTNGVPAPGTPLYAYFDYAFGEGQDLVRAVGFVKLDNATLAEQRAKLGG